MKHNADELVSLNDFVETICKIENNDSITSITNEFCSILTSKYSYESNKCFKADSFDKTRHILLPIELVLKIFLNENIRRTINHESLLNKLQALLEKAYIISNPTCCCCPKKMKKAVSHAFSFTEFVKQGDVEMRRFNLMKADIKFLICLDIEGRESL